MSDVSLASGIKYFVALCLFPIAFQARGATSTLGNFAKATYAGKFLVFERHLFLHLIRYDEKPHQYQSVND